MVTTHTRYVTRIFAPKRRGDTIRRQRLLDLLWRHSDCRLQLLCAPAGFGKTTLVVDFISEMERPVCWYTLDRSDRDPVTFLDYLVEAIRTCFPAFGGEMASRLAAVNDITKELDSVLGALVRDIQSTVHQPFIIVLEDYHQLEDSESVNHVVDFLLEQAPSICHMVMTSRTMPRFPALPRLMSRREVAALGADELRFTPEEIAELFYSAHGATLGREEAAQLAMNSGGWVAGLILTNRVFWDGLLQRLVQQEGQGGALFEYFSQEIFGQLPGELRQFLLSTGILSELEPQFCNALLGLENAQDLLDEAERRNLFLSRLNSERPLYRFHQLFQDFLRAALKGGDPKGYSALNLKAADIYEKRGHWEGAIRHYREVESWCEYARVVREAGGELIKSGRWKTLCEWIDGLPEKVLASAPQLLVWRAQAALRLGDNDVAVKLSNQAIAAWAKEGDSAGMARALLCRGAALRLIGQPKAAMADIRQALAALRDRPEQSDLVAEARKQLGTTYGQQGDFARAKRQLEKSLALYSKTGELADISRVHDLLGIAYLQLGQLVKAATHLEQAKQGWLNLSNWSELARTLHNLGELYRLKGEHERALSELELALANARRSGHARSEAWVLRTIGDVKQDQGEFQAAIEKYTASLELAKRTLDAYLVTECTCAMSNSYRLIGDYDKAESLIEQAMCHAEEKGSGYELGLCLSVLGLIRCGQCRHKEAVAALKRAARLIEPSGNGRELARIHFYLAQVYLSAKNHAAATRHLAQVASLLDELGTDEFIVTDAAQAVWLIEYGASKRIGEARFVGLLEKLRRGQNKSVSGLATHIHPTVPRVEAFALDRGRVLVDGREVRQMEWRSKKSKELFFYLLSHRRGAAKEQIFEALWPEWSPDKLDSCFHPTAYRLRRALYRHCLSFQEGRYLLNPDGEFYYDVETFEKLIPEAEELPKGTERRAAQLQRAIDLYKGSFLEDFYSEWCETVRRDLENQYLRALASLAGYRAARGQYAMSIELLEKCLAIDSYRDDLQYELMNCYLLAGKLGDVIHCYRRYAGLLKKELGVEPPQRIRQLLLKTTGEG